MGIEETKQELTNRLDTVFSRYIRERDCLYHFGRCICCGAPINVPNSDNGHFVPRANMATRFNEQNCNACCKDCNQYQMGNLEAYEVAIDEKWGQGTADELKRLGRTTKHYSRYELQELIDYYNKKLREL